MTTLVAALDTALALAVAAFVLFLLAALIGIWLEWRGLSR